MAGQEGRGGLPTFPSIEVNFDLGNGRNRLHASPPLTPLRTSEDDDRLVALRMAIRGRENSGKGGKSEQCLSNSTYVANSDGLNVSAKSCIKIEWSKLSQESNLSIVTSFKDGGKKVAIILQKANY